jgi:hypothetical protein
MKKLILIFVICSSTALAQKVTKNGTVYKDHPYIEIVKQLAVFYENGDASAMAKAYADNSKLYGMTRYTPNKQKQSAVETGKSLSEAKAGWQEVINNWDHIKMTPIYAPEGLQYENGVFKVQSYWTLSAVNKKTKKTATIQLVLLDWFNKDGKIATQNEYYDPTPLIAAMK